MAIRKASPKASRRRTVPRVDIDDAIAQRLRQIRTERGWTQDDFAVAMNAAEMRWSRGTVAHVEAGERRLSIGELVACAYALGVSVPELLPSDDEAVLLLTGTLTLEPDRVRWLLTAGGSGTRTEPPREADGGLEGWREIGALYAEREEATRKAAKALGITEDDVRERALDRWGMSLARERDRRLAEAAPEEATPRTLQALRGHVTRALLEEIRPDKGV